MKIPFYDLAASHREIRPALDSAWREVMDAGHFILGERLLRFEQRFAAAVGVGHCMGVGNGLDAIALALRALDVKRDDEVIVPSHTFIATWLAVMKLGARPVPVEVDARTYNIDPRLITQAITKKTRAIIPVHLYGQPAAIGEIMAIAKTHGLHVVEDAAQAHGASVGNRRVGSFGDLSAFSFYPVKNLGALGDGGAVCTADAALAERVRLLRNYGSVQKYDHRIEGENSRLDELQAALLDVKLDVLERWNEQRRRVAAAYDEALAGSDGLKLPIVAPGVTPVWHLFVIQSPRRAEIEKALDAAGIGHLVHYPKACHLQGACAELGYARGQFPIAERLAGEVLSLPLWPQMSPSVVGEVAAVVRAALR